MNNPLIRANIFVFILSLIQPTTSFTQTADIILTNGKIFTSDSKQLYVEAIAIRGNKIQLTGSNADIEKLASSKTKRIDLGGKTVVPGFNDAHFHGGPYPMGYYIQYPNDGSQPNWQQMKDSIAKAIQLTPEGTFIYATMGEDVGTDTSIDRTILDKLAPNHPLLIEAYWGHVTFFNTAAIKALRIAEEEPDVKGGLFGRFAGTQKLNGQAFEYACNYLRIKRPTNQQLFIARLKDLGREALYFGVTSIQNMCTGAEPEEYIAVLKRQPLPIRFRLIRWALMEKNGNINIPAKKFAPAVPGLPLVTLSGTKWMLDGTPIERLAWYSLAYKDAQGWYGKLDFTKAEVRTMLRELSIRKDQPMFHAVGDSTIDFLLNELNSSAAIWSSRRVRFEHGDALMPASYALAKKLNVIIVQNPSHFTIVDVLNKRYSPMLMQNAEPMKSLLKAGIPVALGSDGPLNPYLNIMFACMHPFRPSEALTIEEAVIAYTKTSAYAEFRDNKGMLAKGQLADLVVLSQDIFTIPLHQLPATHSVLTMVNGKIVYNELQNN